MIVERVWGWVHAEEATDAPTLQAAVAECIASLAKHGLPIPAGLHALSVDIALQQGHGPQVHPIHVPFARSALRSMCS